MSELQENHTPALPSSEPQAGDEQQAPSNTSATSKGPEKTISCVSCRRRKLKCDRIKPACGTCVRLRHQCEYPERKRNLGSRRRNMKELEDRLAQVETKLVAEQKKNGPQAPVQDAQDFDADWNMLGDEMDLALGDNSFLDETLNMQPSGLEFESFGPNPLENPFSQEVISLGLQEPLPPQHMIDELYSIYFEAFHSLIPMIHKTRFLASLNRPPHMRPSICLQYAMWTTAASMSDKYSCYEQLFYERARRYTELEEMKGFGESFVTVHHVQTLGLLGNYEAKRAIFSRSWMSIGRCVRLAHMLCLHRIDAESRNVKNILPPARDWIELEERRRTFWAAFYGDRWASSGTGWPMTIDEKEISTNLPSSEEAFEQGIEQPSISLEEALSPEGASFISPYGGVILSAALFGHNYLHLHKKGPEERPEDGSNGEFWKRHRKMDNVLSNTFMFLPDNLRLPNGLRDMNIVFLHMNIHASSICLHQAAVITAEKNKTGPQLIKQSRARCLMAAEEISNLMRLTSHVDSSKKNSWMGFCLYLAAGVFIQNLKSDDPSSQSLENLDFLVAALKALVKRHPITEHFVAQLELDIDASGIRRTSLSELPQDGFPPERTFGAMPPNVPMGGVLPTREGVPMEYAELQKLSAQKRKETARSDAPSNILPLYGVYPVIREKLEASNNYIHDPGRAPYSLPLSERPLGTDHSAYESWARGGYRISSTASSNQGDCQLSPPEASDTPSSESSATNTRQYPYRQSAPSAQQTQSHWSREDSSFYGGVAEPLNLTFNQERIKAMDQQQTTINPDDLRSETLWHLDSGNG